MCVCVCVFVLVCACMYSFICVCKSKIMRKETQIYAESFHILLKYLPSLNVSFFISNHH